MLAAFATAMGALLVFGLAAPDSSRATPACTHGLSSIGPVYYVNGKFVGGDTTPHTEACLP